MKSPPEAHGADDSDKRQPATLQPEKLPSAGDSPDAARPESPNDESFAWDPAAADEADPYWVLPGLELNDWPPALRAEVAAIINPSYRELVLLAKPGLAQSTGITIVHLLWLEILDQIELARAKPAANLESNPLQIVALVSGRESRKETIERHLRFVHAKLKASEVLLRLKEFKNNCRSTSQLVPEYPHPNLSALPRRRIDHGKNDFR
jgi:hypothetical protein